MKLSLTLLLDRSAFPMRTLRLVSSDVEVNKQQKNEQDLRYTYKNERSGVPAVFDQRYRGVSYHHHELHDLNLREVPLPPHVRPCRRPQQGQEVVSVHDDMHEAVDDQAQDGMSVGPMSHSVPAHEHHHDMVTHVEEGDVGVLLPKHEEDGVQEVAEPHKHVPPLVFQETYGRLVAGVKVESLADDVVPATDVALEEEARAEEGIEDHHRSVVEEYHGLEVVERMTVLHVARAANLDGVDVREKRRDEKRLVVDEEPVDRPRVGRRQEPSLGSVHGSWSKGAPLQTRQRPKEFVSASATN